MKSRPRRPRSVLFDLDGTLIATRRLYLESYADALEPVFGRRPTHEELLARGPRAERRFLKELAGNAGYREVLDRFYRSYRRRHPQDFEGTYRGVPEMLETLRAAGIPVGLVTGKSRRAWRITETMARLGPFSVAVFDDDVPAPKPDPAGVRIALRRLDLVSNDVIFVGDSATDLEAAARADVRPGAVLWSKRLEERTSFAALAQEVGGRAYETPEELLRAFGLRSG